MLSKIQYIYYFHMSLIIFIADIYYISICGTSTGPNPYDKTSPTKPRDSLFSESSSYGILEIQQALEIPLFNRLLLSLFV